MDSFLLPSFATDEEPRFQLCGDDGMPDPKGKLICSPAPGSTEWLKWFQNRPGTEAMDPDSFATDFDEVFSFKSLKLWRVAVGPADQFASHPRRSGHPRLFRRLADQPLISLGGRLRASGVQQQHLPGDDEYRDAGKQERVDEPVLAP